MQQAASTNPQSAVSERLVGSVERVVYHNTETGWSVLKIRPTSGRRGRRRLLTVVGHCLLIAPGETVEAEGIWTDHSEHGERLNASVLKTTLPREAAAAEMYLGSGLVKGVGPELARRLVTRFGIEVFDVIESRPDLLRDVEGIGPSRAKTLQESWRDQKSTRELMNFLARHGLEAAKAPRILRVLGQDAVRLIEKNPYRLAREVPGIGFRASDRIAKNLGTVIEREERFASALHDRLQRAIERGHCAYPEDTLLIETARDVDASIADVEEALQQEIEAGRLIEEHLGPNSDRPCVAPAALAAVEKHLAQALAHLAHGPTPWGSAAFLDAPPVLRKTGPQPNRARLTIKQSEALRLILSNKVSVLTGGPGTGKTTLIQAVWAELTARGWDVICCAPTGRATQRLTEATGVEAQTIHRLLGWTETGFVNGLQNRLKADLVIVDEVSMVGVELMDALAQSLRPEAALLIVGDSDQLPSVQAGRVLESVLDADVFAHAHLSEVFRQEGGGESLIIRAARSVLEGTSPSIKSERPEQSFHFIEARSADDCIGKIVHMVEARIPQRFAMNAFRDIQVICPMNKGQAGARVLNRRLQERLNPAPPERVDRYGQSFAVGDKVIVTANDYDKDVFNGDIGRVRSIDHARTRLTIELSAPSREVDFQFNELDMLSLAFAITIHKSQGSEYEAVVIPLLEESLVLLSRNLLYTAITRGRRLVVIVGTQRALQLAISSQAARNGLQDRRWSGLGRRIEEAYGAFGGAI